MIEIYDTNKKPINFSYQQSADDDRKIRKQVQEMVNLVKNDGWPAVVDYSEKYDGVKPATDPVTKEQLVRAWEALDPDQQKALKLARQRIERYQRGLLPESKLFTELSGGVLGDLVRPVGRAGCYIPGGHVPLPSSVLMTGYIAEVAGVKEIILCSPPGQDGLPHPVIQAAASLLKDVKLFGVGGVQAVAAMAYGAGKIPPVDIVAGPGNSYVTLAKKEVYGDVDIDMLAGPSEIAIIAEASAAEPRLIAADLLSQAEHDAEARVFLFTPELELIEAVRRELSQLVKDHQHEAVILSSLKNSGLVHTEDLDEAVELSNQLAPEHLELQVEEPLLLARNCKNAGAIFCGNWTPEPIGDYVAGPSHTLPTGGSARFFSPLSVYSFIRHQSLVALNEADYRKIYEETETLAEMESLPAHRYSSAVRREILDDGR